MRTGMRGENNPGANNNVLVTACAVRPSWLFHTWLLFACLLACCDCLILVGV